MEVGDIVEPISSMYTLASGSEWYPWAVCISMEPFLLASQDGDMRWSATVTPERYKSIGKATPEILAAAMTRLLS